MNFNKTIQNGGYMLVYGLDFGTTNSAISLYKDGTLTVLPIGNNKGKTVRSVLFFPRHKIDCDVGEEAIHHYIESEMKGRFLQSLKSLLPEKGFIGSNIHYKHFELEELISLIMGYLKKRADQIVGEEVTSVVLGRPAIFSTEKDGEALAEKRLRDAALMVGFKNVYFQLEPIAAAFTYEQTITKSELVLVADLGGGTSDFTLMQLSREKSIRTDRQGDILATSGVSVGGDRLDSEIMWHRLVKYFGAGSKWSSWGQWSDMPAHLMRRICEWQNIPFLKNTKDREFIKYLLHYSDDRESMKRLQALIEENLGFSLFQAIERAKCQLSTVEKSTFTYNHSAINIRESIGREEFEVMIHKEIDEIEQCVNQLLEKVNTRPAMIDTVFMTGGSSYVPALRTFFERHFGPQKIKTGEMFTSVVAGLGLSAPLFFE